tara:strand:- start:92 stop:448 length:357 start_codon:yes stop_codon:yes gene_type:complete
MDLKYFTLDEFDSPDEPKSGSKMCACFLQICDKIRADFGKPLKVNSGYRTEAHNKKIGGVKNSSHKIGKAADFSCTNSGDRILLLNAIYKNGINRVGVGKGFIHIDTDNSKSDACWIY